MEQQRWVQFQRRCATMAVSGKCMKYMRLREDKFLMWHCLCMFWQLMVRFFVPRTRRDARLLYAPLWLCQAAGDFKFLAARSADDRGVITRSLFRTWNIHDAAHLHMLLPFTTCSDSASLANSARNINVC